MHDSYPAIVLEDVSKRYQRGHLRKRDLKGSLAGWMFERSARHRESFYALKDIRLRIEQGDIVGIVGPNGAGKSTLLKLLSRITYPSSGRIFIHGTLSSMLEVGTGFHPELTGRENIYLNGAIIGMKRAEVTRKLESIIEFSGVREFVDTPVKHYSSGMYVRLAFSVAAHLEPDILLIDEVLAVGDQAFRRKCMDKLLDVSGQGRTILIVSHQMAYLKELCRSGIFLESGHIQYSGSIDETIQHYVSHYESHAGEAVRERKDRRGSGALRMERIDLKDEEGISVRSVHAGQAVRFQLQLKAQVTEVFNVVIQLEFYDMYGQLWFMAGNTITDSSLARLEGTAVLECVIPKIPLNAQMYFVSASVWVSRDLADEVKNILTFEVEPGAFYPSGHLPPINKGMLVEYSWREVK